MSDLISRQAIMALAKDVTLEGGIKHRCIDATQIWEVPSAQPELIEKQPEIIHCRDCKHSDWYETIDGRSFWYCMEHGSHGNGENDFCSRAERKEQP